MKNEKNALLNIYAELLKKALNTEGPIPEDLRQEVIKAHDEALKIAPIEEVDETFVVCWETSTKNSNGFCLSRKYQEFEKTGNWPD